MSSQRDKRPPSKMDNKLPNIVLQEKCASMCSTWQSRTVQEVLSQRLCVGSWGGRVSWPSQFDTGHQCNHIKAHFHGAAQPLRESDPLWHEDLIKSNKFQHHHFCIASFLIKLQYNPLCHWGIWHWIRRQLCLLACAVRVRVHLMRQWLLMDGCFYLN